MQKSVVIAVIKVENDGKAKAEGDPEGEDLLGEGQEGGEKEKEMRKEFLLPQRGLQRRFAFWSEEARSSVQGTLQSVYREPRQSAISEKVPAHIEAVDDRTAEEKKLVDFIVKLQGSEEHLVVL
ncbi:unnamed protein product [Leuciscus chuanchicus]